MMETVLIGLAAVVVGFLLRKLGVEKKAELLAGKVGYALGSIITISLNKISFGLWDKFFEAIFAKVLVKFTTELGKGLDSDEVR